MIALATQLKCARREAAMRRAAYPKWVAAGKMTEGTAGTEIEVMDAIVVTLEKMVMLEEVSAEMRGSMEEDGGRWTEDGGQKAEIKGQRSEGKTEVPLTPALSRPTGEGEGKASAAPPIVTERAAIAAATKKIAAIAPPKMEQGGLF